MLKIAEDKNELVLRDYPVSAPIFGAVIIAVCLMMLSAEYDSIKQFLLTGKLGFIEVIYIFVIVILLISGFLNIFKTPVVTTIINREMRTLTKESKSLIGYEYRNFNFSQIEKAVSVSVRRRKAKYYAPQIKITMTGETIDLIRGKLSSPKKARKIVDLANLYLGQK